jgi:hypothetical protein
MAATHAKYIFDNDWYDNVSNPHTTKDGRDFNARAKEINYGGQIWGENI